MRVAFAAVIFGVLALPAPAMAIDPERFEVATTEDLVQLCQPGGNDPASLEAVAFCHGFATGAYRYHLAVLGMKPDTICFEQDVSRRKVIDEFIEWTRANPDYNDRHAVNTLFRFLEKAYPCS